MAFLVTRPSRAFTFPAAALPRIGGVPVDIEETTDAYLVDLDLPDVNADDVRIDLRDNEIRVAGKYRTRVRAGMLHHHARQEGEFEYIIALPGDIADEDVEANLDSGVLSIIAPKARGEQSRRITVQATQGRLGQQSKQDRSLEQQQTQGRSQGTGPADTPAAQAKQMREGQSRPGPASQQAGSTGTGSTGQVGRSGMS